MTLILDGTLGVSGVAGSASAPALIGTDADSGYYINSANEPSASVNGTAVWNAASTFGFKNRIINGGMTIDQRGSASTPVTINSSSWVTGYSVDRWTAYGQSADGVFTMGQNTTAPAGFTKSLKATVTTADASIGSTQLYLAGQFIEGTNVSDLAWGTASAKAVTLSFKVYSSLTGTFGGSILNQGSNRCYVFSYTISAANTWTSVSVTIPGDTTGTWTTDSGVGIYVLFSIGTGSSYLTTAGSWGASPYYGVTGQTNVIATNGATWYITGVQFEVGSTATSFDFRPYTTEQQLCYRYYEKWGTGQSNMLYIGGGIGMVWAATEVRIQLQYADKRAAPTCSASGTVTWADGTSANATMTSFNFDNPKTRTVLFYGSVGSALIQGRAAQVWWPGTGSFNIEISAEL